MVTMSARWSSRADGDFDAVGRGARRVERARPAVARRDEHAGAAEVGREVVGVVAGPVRGVADGIAPQRVRVGAGLLPHEAAVVLDDLG